MRNRTTQLIIAAILGGLTLFVALGLYQHWQHQQSSMTPGMPSTSPELSRFEVAANWIKRGKPNFRAAEFYRSADGATTSGLFECDASEFEWHYDKDEAIYLLEGRVEMEYLGQRFTVTPGQRVFFKAGTVAKWHVTEKVRKSWTIYQPGRLNRWLTRVFS